MTRRPRPPARPRGRQRTGARDGTPRPGWRPRTCPGERTPGPRVAACVTRQPPPPPAGTRVAARGGPPGVPLTCAAMRPRHPHGSSPRRKRPRKRAVTAQKQNRPSRCWRRGQEPPGPAEAVQGTTPQELPQRAPAKQGGFTAGTSGLKADPLIMAYQSLQYLGPRRLCSSHAVLCLACAAQSHWPSCCFPRTPSSSLPQGLYPHGTLSGIFLLLNSQGSAQMAYKHRALVIPALLK